MKNILLISVFFLSVSCVNSDGELEVPNTTNGICKITKSFNDEVCLTYNADHGSSYCQDTLYAIYQSDISATGYSYSVLEADSCSTSNTVGSCETTKGTLYYYDETFNASTANTDCTSNHSGTFTP